MTVDQIAQLIQFPKFWLWGSLYYIVPWYGDGLLMRVDPDNPEYSRVQGELSEANDVWYGDPDGGGEHAQVQPD